MSTVPNPYVIGAKVLAIVLIVAGVYYLVTDYLAMKKALEAKQGIENVTSVATDAVAEAQTQQGEVRVLIEDKRAKYERDFEELKRENPTVNAWASEPIPDELRNPTSGAIDGPETDSLRRGSPDKTD